MKTTSLFAAVIGSGLLISRAHETKAAPRADAPQVPQALENSDDISKTMQDKIKEYKQLRDRSEKLDKEGRRLGAQAEQKRWEIDRLNVQRIKQSGFASPEENRRYLQFAESRPYRDFGTLRRGVRHLDEAPSVIDGGSAALELRKVVAENSVKTVAGNPKTRTLNYELAPTEIVEYRYPHDFSLIVGYKLFYRVEWRRFMSTERYDVALSFSPQGKLLDVDDSDIQWRNW